MRVLVLPYRRWLDDHWRRALIIKRIPDQRRAVAAPGGVADARQFALQ
jgi:hypothetical protein